MARPVELTPHQVYTWLCAHAGTHTAKAICYAMAVKPSTLQRRLHECVAAGSVRRTGGVKGPGVMWEAA